MVGSLSSIQIPNFSIITPPDETDVRQFAYVWFFSLVRAFTFFCTFQHKFKRIFSNLQPRRHRRRHNTYFKSFIPNECILNISFVSLKSFKCTTILFFSLFASSIERSGPSAAPSRQSGTSLIYAIYSSFVVQRYVQNSVALIYCAICAL